ncbi:uncharacterized protein LOC101850014 [Aplysia californica]|uniref:Uncharacterized protein LOC101850014 n=1 Tax=Aplysia californica TaxID=6500 RepID=A0ABM1A3E4_APLCA|nr:uncharacterized protein LOC101850014 [Aplysia californica]
MRSTLVVLSILLFITQTADAACYDDEAKCLTDFKSLLTNTSMFWYGSGYVTRCPAGVSREEPSCNNPDPNRRSVLSRLLKTDFTATLQGYASGLSLANVTFTSTAETVFACGHSFKVPAVNDQRVDPLSLSSTSQRSLAYTPEVTWTSASGTLYTVVVWDVGSFALHGLYINAVNGTLATGEEVVEYRGPRNPFFYGNQYLFLVLPQTSTLVRSVVESVFANAITDKQFNAIPLVTQLSLGNAVAANLLNILGDVYGAQLTKESGILNNCPLYASQLAVLRNGLRWANISATWSMPTPEEGAPYLASVEVGLDPAYRTADFSFESCCSNFSYLGAVLIPDPFSTRAERPVQVRSQPAIQIAPRDMLNKERIVNDKMYTLILMDLGETEQKVPPKSAENDVHWLVTDIPGDDVASGNHLIPYFGPNPFTRYQVRMYTFLLLEQPSASLNASTLVDYAINSAVSPTCKDPANDKCSYDVGSLFRGWGLEIRGVSWLFAEQDPFARRRMYKEFAVRPKSVACKGVEGYAEPCPLRCVNVGDHLSSGTAALCLMAALAIGYFFSM